MKILRVVLSICVITYWGCGDEFTLISETPEPMEGECLEDVSFVDIPDWDYEVIEIPHSFNRGWKPYFIDENTGFLYGSDNVLRKTTNGGKDWNIVYRELQNISYWSMHFIDDRVGFLSTQNKRESGNSTFYGSLLKTTNAGDTWEVIDSEPEGILRNLQFINEDEGFAITGGESFDPDDYMSYLIKTGDGGKTWQKVDDIIVPSTVKNILKIFSDGFGYVGGVERKIYFTDNFGKDWYSKETPSGFNSLQFLDQKNGFIYRFKELLKTTDGGDTWTTISNLETNFYHFFSPDNGISLQAVYVTDFGDYNISCYAFLTTGDGGNTWKRGEALTEFQLSGVHFLNDKLGYGAFNFNPGNFVIFKR